MKKLLLLSVALIAASSVVNASENSGNIRNVIIAQAAEKAAQLTAELAEANKGIAQEAVGYAKWYQSGSDLDKAIAGESSRSMLQRLASAWDVTKTFVTGHAKNAFDSVIKSEKTQKAVAYVQPRFESAKAWANGLELGAKAKTIQQGLYNGYATSTQYVAETEAFKYAQGTYTTVVNSDIAKKMSDYANQGIELVKENPKTAGALAAGTTVIAVTAWLVKKLYSVPAKKAEQTQKNDGIKVSVPNEQLSYVVTTEIVPVPPASPVASLYPTEDMETYAEFVNERDHIEGSTPSIYPRPN